MGSLLRKEIKMENNINDVKMMAELMFQAYLKGYEAAKEKETAIQTEVPEKKVRRYSKRAGKKTTVIDETGKKYTANTRSEIEELVLKRGNGYIGGCLADGRPIYEADGREYWLCETN